MKNPASAARRPAPCRPASAQGFAPLTERVVLIGQQAERQVGAGEHRGRVDPGRPAIPARDAGRRIEALAHPGASFGQGRGLDRRIQDLERPDRPHGKLDRALDPPPPHARVEEEVRPQDHRHGDLDLVARFAKGLGQGRDQRVGRRLRLAHEARGTACGR